MWLGERDDTGAEELETRLRQVEYQFNQVAHVCRGRQAGDMEPALKLADDDEIVQDRVLRTHNMSPGLSSM